jgi:hypothetical protein
MTNERKPFICWCGFNTMNVGEASEHTKAHCNHKHTVIFDKEEEDKTGIFCLHCLREINGTPST